MEKGKENIESNNQTEKSKWKVLKREYIEKNKWISLRVDTCETPKGDKINEYYVMELNDVCCILAMTKDKQIVMIQEYKHGVEKVVNQIPSGYLDDNEDPLESAKRELLEETGYTSQKWIPLAKLTASPGRLNHYYHYFLALDAEKVQEQNLEPGESVKVQLVTVQDAQKIMKEKTSDMTLPTVLSLAKEFLE